MNTNRLSTLLLAALLAAFGCRIHAQDPVFSNPPKVQVVKVAGTEITGLNAFSLAQEIEAAKASGATAIVIDLKRVQRLTPAGLTPFEHAIEELGSDHVGLVGVARQPHQVLSGSGISYRLFDSVEEAAAAVKKTPP
jgi:anti-anti-sigma regulatory factor